MARKSRFSNEEITEIVNQLKSGMSATTVAKNFDTTKTTICRIGRENNIEFDKGTPRRVIYYKIPDNGTVLVSKESVEIIKRIFKQKGFDDCSEISKQVKVSARVLEKFFSTQKIKISNLNKINEFTQCSAMEREF